jgi:aspartate/methionine/tyrosine aminotransferase
MTGARTLRSVSQRAAAIAPSVMRELFDARRPTSINLGWGEATIPTDPELLEAGWAEYRRAPGGYTLNAGLPELRLAIAEYRGLPQAPSAAHVVVTTAATGGLVATLLALGDPGDEVVILDPTFFNYERAIRLIGMVPIRVPRLPGCGWAIDIDALAASVGEHTRAVIVPSPDNPTGRIDPLADLEAIVAATAAADVWLVSDEVGREIHFTDAPPPSLGELSDRAIVIGSLSKSCSMAGFRVGYVLAPAPMAGAITAAHAVNVVCAPSVSQHVALAAMHDWRRWLYANLPVYRRRRDLLLSTIDERLGLPVVPPEGGTTALVDFRSTGLGSLELARRLLAEADVVTAPGLAFGPGGEGYLRLTHAIPDGEIEEGVSRIAKFLAPR